MKNFQVIILANAKLTAFCRFIKSQVTLLLITVLLGVFYYFLHLKRPFYKCPAKHVFLIVS